MSALELARTQFGITTIFHFIFVPITIGLALWVAICQTRWYRTRDEVYLRMTRFWGKFFLISVAIGVVTGIVQEFQFGMNWSLYSRYVGDIFGAPLAMEGLAAFFLESTFIGLWIFGWNRLSPKLHLWTIWLTAVGTMLSAFFILAANSWMQHPVGYTINHVTHRAELKNIFSVLTNSTVLLAFPHTVLGAWTTGAMVVLGVSAIGLLVGRRSEVYTRSIRMVLPMALFSVLATMVFGHFQALLMDKQQPMKMASAEALYNDSKGASLSMFAVGPFERAPDHLSTDIRVPHALSLLATATWNGKVRGINDIQAEYQRKYGPGDYIPIVGVTYWSFRIMIGTGVAIMLIALLGLILQRKRRLESTRWFHWVAIAGIFMPILANWTGWIFTEVGRQPWVVFGLLQTKDARSPNVSATSIAITLTGYILIYGALCVIGTWLFIREAKHGPGEPLPPEPPEGDGAESLDRELVLAY